MTQSQSQHNAEIEGLQHRNNELKSLLSSAKTETSQCMKQYDSLMEQHRVVDLSKVKLDNHCEVMTCVWVVTWWFFISEYFMGVYVAQLRDSCY